MTSEKENIFNLPNFLSFYRLLSFPFIFWLAWSGREQLFTILFCINLVTDVLDGFIARHFNLATKFGAQLDNLADFGSYVLAIYGMYAFRWTAVSPYALLLYVFVGVFLLSNIIGWIRFRQMPGMHLLSCVIAGYGQGLFFFCLFAWKFFPVFFCLSLGWGVLAYLEKCIVLLIIPELKAGTKGLYSGLCPATTVKE